MLISKINNNRNYRVDRRVMRRYFSKTGIYSWFGEDSYRIKSRKSYQRDDRKVTPIRDIDYILNVLDVNDLLISLNDNNIQLFSKIENSQL